VMCLCAVGTLITVIALAMVLLFALPKSDDNATAAGLVSGDGTQSPFIVVPLNTTDTAQTRAAHKCAENHSWLNSVGLCGIVGTMQDWFGWGDDSNPYDAMLSDSPSTSIDKNRLCVMPCSDGSGDYGVCVCQRPSLMSAFRDDARCECPSLGRSTAAAASDDSGAGGIAMNHSPPSNDDGDDTLAPLFDDLVDDDDDSVDDDDTITNPDSPDTPSTDDNSDDGDTYMLITDKNTGTSCLLHCPHLTHFHWPGETRRVLNCREYVQLMSPDLCDVVDTLTR